MIGIIFLLAFMFVALMAFVIPGVNFFIWVLLYLLAIYVLKGGLHIKDDGDGSHLEKSKYKRILKLLLPALLLSSLILYRTNLLVIFFITILSIVLLYLYPGVGKVRSDIFGTVKVIASPILFGLGWLKDGYEYLKSGATGAKSSSRGSRNGKNIMFGLLLSVPFLFIFTILFYIGDSSFSAMLDNLGNSINEFLSTFNLQDIRVDEVISRIIIFTIMFTLLIPVIHSTVRNNSSLRTFNDKLDGYLEKYKRDLSVNKWNAFLLPIILLFILFIISQVDYLYGGVGNILGDDAKYTFAEYARRGFVELSIVTFIVCGILMFIGTRVERVKKVGITIDTIFTGLLVVFTGLMSISAFSRMVLLIDAYGLTNTRLFGLIFLLGLLFALFLYFVGYIKQRSLGWYDKMSSYLLVCIVFLFLLIPTDLVVGFSQMQRAENGKQMDYSYLLSLSEEAQVYVAPKLLDKFDEDEDPVQYHLIRRNYADLDERLDRLELRSMNITRLVLMSRLDEYNLLVRTKPEKLAEYMDEYVREYVDLLKDENYEEAYNRFWSPSFVFSGLEADGGYELIDGRIVQPDSQLFQDGVWGFLNEPLAIELPIKFKFREIRTGEEKCILDSHYVQLVGDEMKITNSMLFPLGKYEGEEVSRVGMFELLDDQYFPYGENCDY